MNCPKCGADMLEQTANDKAANNRQWTCGTVSIDGAIEESKTCLRRQRDALAARVKELEAKLDEEREFHAWEVSPAMAQAKINELNARVKELESFEQICKDPATLWLQWTRGNVALPEGIGDVRAMEERVKRLKEAGDNLARFCVAGFDIDKWNAAKESKP